MKWVDCFARWPVLRQLKAGDLHGLGATAATGRSEQLQPRTRGADIVKRSVCPYCAVGCGQLVGGTEWETLPLEQAMELVARRVKKTRDET